MSNGHLTLLSPLFLLLHSNKNATDSNKNLTDVGFKLLCIIQIVLEGNRVTIMNREQEARGTKIRCQVSLVEKDFQDLSGSASSVF